MDKVKDYKLVYCNTDSNDNAIAMANELVNRKVVACVSIIPNITSVYQWEGKVETGQEFMLIIKTKKSNLEQLEQIINKLHPYDVPEIISIGIDSISKPYKLWINEVVNDK